MLALGLLDGLGLMLRLGLCDFDPDGLILRLALPVADALALGEAEPDGEVDWDCDRLPDGDALALGLPDGLSEPDARLA